MAWELKTLNHGHQGVLQWLLANPHRTLLECAKELGYTTVALRLIMSSDAFQAEYAQRAQEAGLEVAHHSFDIRRKLKLLAHTTVDDLLNKAELGLLSPRETLSAGNLALKSLGYGQPSPTSAMQVNLTVNTAVLEAARSRVLLTKQASEPVTIELPATEVAA